MANNLKVKITSKARAIGIGRAGRAFLSSVMTARRIVYSAPMKIAIPANSVAISPRYARE